MSALRTYIRDAMRGTSDEARDVASSSRSDLERLAWHVAGPYWADLAGRCHRVAHPAGWQEPLPWWPDYERLMRRRRRLVLLTPRAVALAAGGAS